jgi:hypothetical protein
MSNSPGPQIEIDTGQPSRLWRRVIGVVLLISAAVLGTYLIVAYFGWQSGRQTQAATDSQALALSRQVDLAREDFAEGSSDLALRRLQWVLDQDGSHSAALTLQGEIVAAQAAAATPTAAPTVAATATAEGTTPTVSDADILPALREIRRLVGQEAWDEALPALLAFQQSNPDYERRETDELLYTTYLRLGLATIEGDATELGLNYLAQAERLGNLPPEAQDYRYWANLYLDGIAYYGVNWEVAGFYFRDLCAAAPFFQNACQLLNEVLSNQAGQLAAAGDWCPAETIYQELWRQDRTFEGQLAQARENCALATPVPITGTESLTGTLPIIEPTPGE